MGKNKVSFLNTIHESCLFNMNPLTYARDAYPTLWPSKRHCWTINTIPNSFPDTTDNSIFLKQDKTWWQQTKYLTDPICLDLTTQEQMFYKPKDWPPSRPKASEKTNPQPVQALNQHNTPKKMDLNAIWHLTGVWPWVNDLTSLYFNFFVCRRGVIKYPSDRIIV
jgi:hypothetical protein